jgi:intracellular septation protein
MAEHIALPAQVWSRLNTAWVLFFIVSGVLNLYVAFSFSEEIWVDFKLFGLLGLTLIFIVAQSVYLAKHAENLSKPNQDN